MNLKQVSLLLGLCLAAPSAVAATFYVTTTADAGNGSLRAAIEAANAAPTGLHTVLFDLPPNRTITLQSRLPNVTARSVILDGAAAERLTITAPNSGILTLGEANRLFSLRNLTLGPSSSPSAGGCLAAFPPSPGANASVLITDVQFYACKSVPAASLSVGGAVLVQDRSLLVTRGTFEFNYASTPQGFGPSVSYGGAIFVDGDASTTATITDSFFGENRALGSASDGSAAAFGGAIASFSARLHITSSRFSENGAEAFGDGQARGGHIWTTGSMRIDDSLFWEGGSDFGGVVAESSVNGPTLWLRNNSLYGVASDEGPAMYSNFAAVELRSNSFLATESDSTRAVDVVVDAPPDSSGLLQLSNNAFQARSAGSIRPGCAVGTGVQVQNAWNLSDRQNTGCGIAAVPAGSLLLQPPATLGGPADVIAPLPGSTAIDAGNPAAADASSWDRCMFADARGVPRPQDGDGDGIARCDVGAMEFTPDALFADGFEP